MTHLATKFENMTTHIVKLPTRTIRLRIQDLPNLILVELSASAYGENFNDEELVRDWLDPIVSEYTPTKRLGILTRH